MPYDLIRIIFLYYNTRTETIPYVHDFRNEKFYVQKRHSYHIMQLEGISNPVYYINNHLLNNLRSVIGELLKNKTITIKKKRLGEIEEFAEKIKFVYCIEKYEYQIHKGRSGGIIKNKVRLTIPVDISLPELRNALLP